ncbi:UNVERIFIED_CONTAM: Top3b [Trichonephila clavipes]
MKLLLFLQNKYGNLDSALISYGPCQTPTLGFCVERHDRIASFKPETYYVLSVKVTSSNLKVLTLDWDRIRIFDNEVANVFYQMVKKKTDAVVTNVTKKEKAKQRPLALNTVELMRVASSGLNMGPHYAMTIAERLYTQGYISYPRTETTSYPANFDIRGILQLQSKSAEWGNDVQELLSGTMAPPSTFRASAPQVQGSNSELDKVNSAFHPFWRSINEYQSSAWSCQTDHMTGTSAHAPQCSRKGHDAGDHPPITPMKLASRNELDNDAWKVYDYISRHFIATVSPDMKYVQTVIAFRIGEETFTCTGKTLIDPGYTKVMTWQSMSAEETLPDLKKGDVLKISEVSDFFIL